MDTSNMQEFSANSSTAQQSVIHGTTPMSVNQQGSGVNSLLYTATIYSQDMSQANQQMMAMRQQQQQNDSSQQAMMSDMNPFISGGMGMGQQQSHQSNDQMGGEGDDDKESYKGKYSREYLKTQLP